MISLECQGNFPFSQTPWAQAETTNPLLLVVIMLIVNYPLPAYVKEVCVYLFTFYPIPEVSSLHFLLPLLIYHQWTSTNPFMAPPLTLRYKVRC